ncbi:MAG: FAD-binding oxidoreductase [Chitinivibrionales bacterium]|nr:FAD-binding oxidoreductase [Chitinivibrionales bacterium]
MNYATLTPAHIEKLTAIVGAGNIITEKEKMIDYSHDEFSQAEIAHFPDIVVKPHTTEEVSRIMKLASEQNLPVTPRGGATGLCGGCVPIYGGIVLSLEGLKKIVEIDTENVMAVAEAGVTLQELYQAIEAKGLYLPPHPGDENATVGGLVVCNAGGARAVKYGVIRNFVRGLEVVMPDGQVTMLGGKLIKSSSGYSLLHLMIGSEGTLGVVTKAIINLYPPPQAIYTLVVPFNSLGEAIKTVPAIIQGTIMPMAVEFLERETIAVTEDFLNRTWPTKDGSAYLMIILDGSSEDELMQQAEAIGQLCLDKGALDVFVADDKTKQHNILEIRSQTYEAMRGNMLEILDVTVPRASIADFVAAVHKASEEMGIWLPTYGHAADGNVHTHIMRARFDKGKWTETPGWQEKYEKARDRVHELGKEFGGIVSGEHGIGMVKKEYLTHFLDQVQLSLMRGIKQVFDPKGICNPGKVI